MLFPPQAACSALCRKSGRSQSPIHPTHSLHWTHEEKHLLKIHRLLGTGKKATGFPWDTHRLSVPAFLLSECQTWANWTSPDHLLMNSCVWNPCYNIHHFRVFYVSNSFRFYCIYTPTLTEGEGNGTPLQYSCLENPEDGEAWWAAVHGVAKSLTRLSDFSYTFHFHALEKDGNPLQCSCLENPRDWGAWWAAVYGVA